MVLEEGSLLRDSPRPAHRIRTGVGRYRKKAMEERGEKNTTTGLKEQKNSKKEAVGDV